MLVELNKRVAIGRGVCRPLKMTRMTECNIVGQVNHGFTTRVRFQVETSRTVPMELVVRFFWDERYKSVAVVSRRQVSWFASHVAPCAEAANKARIDLHLCDCAST